MAVLDQKSTSESATQPIKRFEGVRRRELVKMVMTIKELDMTAKGEAIMLMMTVTRFTTKRCEAPSKLGSGK